MNCPHHNNPATCSWCKQDVPPPPSIAFKGCKRGIHPWPSDDACGYCQEEAQAAERVRIDRWHATYNAALSIQLPWLNEDTLEEHAEDHIKVALYVANTQHGPLVKP